MATTLSLVTLLLVETLSASKLAPEEGTSIARGDEDDEDDEEEEEEEEMEDALVR